MVPLVNGTSASGPPGEDAAAARPLRADARRNRERIAAAAEAEFGRVGGLAQMDTIAANAGVGVGTVYRHFPTKEALVDQLIRARFEAMAAEASAALEDPAPWGSFAAYMLACAEACAQNAGTRFAFMAGDVARLGELAAETGLEARTQELIDRGVAAGAIRADLLAADVGMVVCGLAASVDRPVGDWRRHLEFVLDGLRRSPGVAA